LFNKGKLKIFPLQSLEEITVDPSKFNHNKKVIQEVIRAKKEQEKMDLKGLAKSRSQKQIIGSKYRFQKSRV
jgi:hypothetical protein